jgi:hypothetical protein
MHYLKQGEDSPALGIKEKVAPEFQGRLWIRKSTHSLSFLFQSGADFQNILLRVFQVLLKIANFVLLI